jgi:hypothetical protein
VPPRRTSQGTRAASVQLSTADKDARVGKSTRAREEDGVLIIPLRDKEFRVADEVGIMALMEWAASAEAKQAGIEGLRAVYYVLEDVVHEDDWSEFKSYARAEKVTAEELMGFANAAFEAVSGRPTEEPSGS